MSGRGRPPPAPHVTGRGGACASPPPPEPRGAYLEAAYLVAERRRAPSSCRSRRDFEAALGNAFETLNARKSRPWPGEASSSRVALQLDDPALSPCRPG